MSAQRTKKKKFGSRRGVATQNKTLMADECHSTDGASVAHQIPGENNESLSGLVNSESSQSETLHPPSPDFTSSRRKLGSRRKNKGEAHALDLATKLYHAPREEVEANASGDEALETTQLSLAIQFERQEELSQASEQDMSATHDSSTYSATVGSSDLNSSSVHTCHSADQQQTDQSNSRETSEELLSVYSATEKENKERDEGTDLFRQDGNVHSNYLISESHVESVVIGFSTTTEITTGNNSPRQNTEFECNIEQVPFSLPTEELPADNNPNEQLCPSLDSQPEDNSCSNSILNKRKLGSSRRNRGQQHVNNSVAESHHDTKEEDVRGNEAFETATAAAQVKSVETDKSDTHQTEKFSGQVKETLQLANISELNSPTLHPTSSADQQLINQSNVREMPDEEYSNVYSVTDTESKGRDEDTDLLKQWGILQANNLTDESYLKSEDIESSVPPEISTEKSGYTEYTAPECSVEQATVSSPSEQLSTNEGKNEHFSSSEVRGTQPSEDVVNKIHEEEEVKPTEMQENHFHDYSSASVIHDATENSAITLAILTDQDEVGDTHQPELSVKSFDDSATKQEVSISDTTEESNSEALEHINEDYHVYDTNKPQTSDIDRADTALGQVYENDSLVRHDTETANAEQRSHQVKDGLLFEMEGSKSSPETPPTGTNAIFDPQPQDNSMKSDTPTLNFNSPLETTMSLSLKTTVQEISMKTMPEEKDKYDPPQTGEISDEIKENAHVSTSELASSSVQSTPTLDQQVINQSNVSERLDEEFSNLYSVTDTESKGRDEDTDLLRQWGILQANNLMDESHLKSEDIESSVPPEISTEKSSDTEYTAPECSVEQATVSSPSEQLSTNEGKNEHFSSSEVRGTQPSEDGVNKMHEEEEVKPPDMQDTRQSDDSSVTESKSSSQTLHLEIMSTLDSEPMDNSQSVNEETYSGFNLIGNRRKLGSSRRNKGRQHVPDSGLETYPEFREEAVKSTWDDEASITEAIPLAKETTRQEESREQTSPAFKPAEKIRQIRSGVKENTEICLTTDIASRSDNDDSLRSTEEVSEVEKKQHFTPLTEDDPVKMDLIQSAEASVWRDDTDTQNISYHNDNGSTDTVTSEAHGQEEAIQVQNADTISCDKDSLGQEICDDAESSTDVQVPGQVEVGEEHKDPANKDHAAQYIKTSNEVTHAETFSAAPNKLDTWSPFNIGHEENLRAKPAVDLYEESGFSTAVVACNSQDIPGKTLVDKSDNLQGKVKQKRRKMGSTRRTQLHRKQEDGEMNNKASDIEADVTNSDGMEVAGDLKATAEVTEEVKGRPSPSSVYEEQQETNETSCVHEGQKVQSSTSDLQTIKRNTAPDNSMALLPEVSASHNEEVVNAVTFVHAADVRDSEGNVDVSVQLPQSDNLTRIDTQTTSVIAGRNRCSITPTAPLPPNTESAINTDSETKVSLSETAQIIQDDEQSPGGVIEKSTESSSEARVDLEKVKSVVWGGSGEEHMNTQASIPEPKSVTEGAHNPDFEMKNAEESPNSSSTSRRRKLGSTRRNLGSRSKGEALYQKHEVDNEETATNVDGALTDNVSGVEEKELQLHSEHKDSEMEQRKENVHETAECSHTSESQSKPLHPQMAEGNPDSAQLTPEFRPAEPFTFPSQVTSESAAGGRRRKMGSHRKSRGHHNPEDQTGREDGVIDTQKGGNVRSLTDEIAIKTIEEQRGEPLGLEKISEVDESAKNLLSNMGRSTKTQERVTPVQYPHAEIHLSQESQKRMSFGEPRGADTRLKSYNVLMVGDTSVGKTSFMKRAQSGKFSSDLVASVGLDSCMWTVVVDGKPVVLQLWDTAGQERFHSITRQVFHKAQAFLLMYDISSSRSFSAVRYWANCIEEGAAEDVTILLLGNKSDCGERQVKTWEGEVLAKECNFGFMECSAATGENVIQSLETVARMLSQKDDTRREAMVLHKEPPRRKRSGCC